MIVPTLSTLVSVRFRCSDDLSAAGGENPLFYRKSHLLSSSGRSGQCTAAWSWLAAPPPTNVSRLIFRHQMFFPQTFDHMLHSANPSSIQGFTMSSGSRVRNCTHEGWRGAVPLCQGSILSLPSSRGEKTVHLKRVEESLSIISRTHTLPSCTGRNRVWFRIEVVDMRGNSFFCAALR